MSRKKALRDEISKQQRFLDEGLESFKQFPLENVYSGITAPTLGDAPASNLTNLSERFTNPFVGLQNFQAQRENTFEDLTINQREAEFLAQQQQQGLSNTLGSLRGAAGSSGIAALAQAVSGVQSQNLQRAAASIGQQEADINQQRATQEFTLQGAVASEAALNQQTILAQEIANQRAIAEEGSRNQLLAAQQQQQRDLTLADLDLRSQMFRAQGADIAQQRQFDREATALGIQAQRTVGAQQDLQNLLNRRAQILGSVIGGAGEAGGSIGAAMIMSAASDRRLKKNIKFLTKSNKGYNIYTFEYKNKKYGEGIYQGVMSDEIPIENVIVNKDGYDMVNYSNLDVEFKRV